MESASSDLARRCAALRAYHEARLRGMAAAGNVSLWSGPSLRGDRGRRGRLPRDEDGGGPSWDDAVRAIER